MQTAHHVDHQGQGVSGDTSQIAGLPLKRIVELFNALQDEPDIRDLIFAREPVLSQVRMALTSAGTEAPIPEHEVLFDPTAATLVARSYQQDCTEEETRRLAALLIRLLESGDRSRLLALLTAVPLPRGTLKHLDGERLYDGLKDQVQILGQLAARDASRALDLARQLVETSSNRPFMHLIVTGMGDRLSNEQIWELLCATVRRRAKQERVRAFCALIEALDADRAGQILAQMHDDSAIKAYWPLLPKGVRQALIGLGRGRIFNSDSTTSNTTGQNSRSAFGGRRSHRYSRQQSWERYRKAANQAKAPGREARAALRVMVRAFGFRETMSYDEAQRLYWRLAMRWHPDRCGSSPVFEQKIRDLNSAWDQAKVCFAR